MKQVFHCLFVWALVMLNIVSPASAQTSWTRAGAIQNASNNLNYFKLLQVNASNHRYSTIVEVSVQADANYFNQQGTYSIRVDKYENTPDRFDGLEIVCTSGNPAAATFYIYNNALWVRSNFLWGFVYYRTESNFEFDNPLNTAPFGVTTTAPTGFATSVAGPIKCDFDNNVFTRLPLTDPSGAQTFYNSVSIFGNKPFGVSLTDNFTYDGKPQPHYGFQWTSDSWNTGAYSFWLSGAGGIKLFTNGLPRMVINRTGNVGIGTTNPSSEAMLTVNGAIFSQRVKVEQKNWADFVFEPEYKLPSLAELETYIKANKHLPNVPSAKDVVKEGIDVGEMNKILLQKIEELTLHLIEESKRNRDLEEKVRLITEELKSK
ncbi:hypothetical protein SAMN05428949_0783 [Chitinophaga sp. YR627]|uniref:hypothetical protein n=1 Tax=Chitinophaga sp. YR627 TaxID=1881041 RepID=UPI0008E38474|nr:hypothetical protein [Chitinophaga sp. YR627]SFM78580.1 hypothetical protein SAMN05428949_0783 [Chitinophaga sp. YR627]